MALGGWVLVALGSHNGVVSDQVMRLGILECLGGHHVSQISTALDHTVVVTNHGKIFGFGDNERAQLGHDTLRACLEPTQIFFHEMTDDTNVVSDSE